MNDTVESGVVVSVCCIAYNQEKFIRQALDSFVMQKTSFKFEILVHDDASTDKTADIIREFENRYPELVKSVIQKENICKEGMETGKFYGYEPFCRFLFPIAKGKYLALCEGDDYWTDPHKLQRQVIFMDNHPEFSMSYHRTDMLLEDGKKIPYDPAHVVGKNFNPEQMVKTPVGIATASKMLRNYYSEDTKKHYWDMSGDYLLNGYYATFGGCGFVDGIKPSVYRVHKDGMWTGKIHKQKMALVWILNTKLCAKYKELGQDRLAEIRRDVMYDQLLFGIIIPTYQRGDGKTPFYLKRCLDSVYRQGHQEFYIYVMGDDYANKEEIDKIIESYPQDGRIIFEDLPVGLERVKYVDNKEALWSFGGLNATNLALQKAKEDGVRYVCLLDHDDFWRWDHLEVLKQTFKTTNAAWLCTKTSVDPGITVFFPRGMEGRALEEFLPAPGNCIKSSVCWDMESLPFKMRDTLEEEGKIYPADADLWQRMSDYIIKNNLKSYYIGTHTCYHDTEGYIRKGGLAKDSAKNRITLKDVDELITGIVVCYNTKDLIKRAYESVRQFHPKMKIIIVDGSDEDNECCDYVCGLVGEYTRVFRANKNIGHGIGLKVGLFYTETPYALLFDSDIEMLKSPVLEMLRMMENDTYGVGYIEKTAFDGHEWGSLPHHKRQGWMRYLHPYFCLIQLKEYQKYEPFIHHGAPAVNTMLDIHRKGLGNKVIKEFPGLGHSSGKGWVWEGQPREFIRHDPAGTRGYRRSKGLEEIEGVWEKVMSL